MTLPDLIRELDLVPHPEGGYYRELYRDGTLDEQGALTTIYFALEHDRPSRWHRVLGSAEVWCYHAGAPVLLKTSDSLTNGHQGTKTTVLGIEISKEQRPQYVVKPDLWQMAETMGAWSLVSCVVAPAFSFENFEMAPEIIKMS